MVIHFVMKFSRRISYILLGILLKNNCKEFMDVGSTVLVMR